LLGSLITSFCFMNIIVLIVHAKVIHSVNNTWLKTPIKIIGDSLCSKKDLSDLILIILQSINILFINAILYIVYKRVKVNRYLVSVICTHKKLVDLINKKHCNLNYLFLIYIYFVNCEQLYLLQQTLVFVKVYF